MEARARARNSQGWSGWSGTATFAKGDITVVGSSTRFFTSSGFVSYSGAPTAVVTFQSTGVLNARSTATIVFYESDERTVVATVTFLSNVNQSILETKYVTGLSAARVVRMTQATGNMTSAAVLPLG